MLAGLSLWGLGRFILIEHLFLGTYDRYKLKKIPRGLREPQPQEPSKDRNACHESQGQRISENGRFQGPTIGTFYVKIKKNRAMGLLDFSYTLYLKAVSVKSPGLKKLNLIFSDALMSTSTLAQSQPWAMTTDFSSETKWKGWPPEFRAFWGKAQNCQIYM